MSINFHHSLTQCMRYRLIASMREYGRWLLMVLVDGVVRIDLRQMFEILKTDPANRRVTLPANWNFETTTTSTFRQAVHTPVQAMV